VIKPRTAQMLIEAKDQVGHGGWGKWLKKNFDLSAWTATTYMRWARLHHQIGDGTPDLPRSLTEMTGKTDRRREERQSTQQQAFRRVLGFAFCAGMDAPRNPDVARTRLSSLSRPCFKSLHLR
jgi:hypothetical protein